MRILLGALALALAVPVVGSPAQAESNPAQDWREQVVDAGQSFRGLDAVDRSTAWISGGSVTEGGPGTVWRTTDGGDTWNDVSPPDSEGLLFRDVEARSAERRAGAGDRSRGGVPDLPHHRWWPDLDRDVPQRGRGGVLQLHGLLPGGRRGLAVSDPVDGKFRIISTHNGGRSWEVLPTDGMPDATGEANFAASGDCLVIRGEHAWFGSGGAAARIFHSTDRGYTWEATDSTIPSGESAGVFGLAFKTPRRGLAVGGDFAAPDVAEDASAHTRNGLSWRNGGDLEVLAEDAAWIGGRHDRIVVSTGESGETGGSHLSWDGGRSWHAVQRHRLPHAGLHQGPVVLGGRRRGPGRADRLLDPRQRAVVAALDLGERRDRGQQRHRVVERQRVLAARHRAEHRARTSRRRSARASGCRPRGR